MLCLSRKVNERIYIGPDIVIKVIRLDHNQVRLGIEAPEGVVIIREELRLQDARAEPATAGERRK